MLPTLPPSPEYLADFESWRIRRPAWRALLAGIRGDAPESELRDLAAPAGATAQEVYELRQIRVRALRQVPEARKFKAAAERKAELDDAVEQLQSAAENATADQYQTAMLALAEAVKIRDRHFRGEYLGAEQAARYVELARGKGVL